MVQSSSGFGSGGIDLQLGALTHAYSTHILTPRDVINAVYERAASFEGKNIWAHLLPREETVRQIERAELRLRSGQALPLYGIPFAVADNIDVAGMPTAFGCAAYGSSPTVSAPVVQCLVDAGAICLGKTNLDQFGLGLAGVTSSFGSCVSAFDDEHIAGGSNAGSALAVALGLVSFALGTDGGGETLIPAALNNVMGMRVGKGLTSGRGLRFSRRSLDALGIFAGNAYDVHAVLAVAHAYDEHDPYARHPPPARARTESATLAVPVQGNLKFFGDTLAMHQFEATVRSLEDLGWSVTERNLEPLLQLGAELSAAECASEVGAFVSANPDRVDPYVRRELSRLTDCTAANVYQHLRQVAEAKLAVSKIWLAVDGLVLPTVPTTFRTAEFAARPSECEVALRCYATLAATLDLCAVSVPTGFKSPDMPFGTTLLAPAGEEGSALRLAAQLHERWQSKVGATRIAVGTFAPPDPLAAAVGVAEAFLNLGAVAAASASQLSRRPEETLVEIAMVGTHLQGETHHHQLLELDAQFMKSTRTSSRYELFAVTDKGADVPALVRRNQPSGSVRVEVYRLRAADFGKLVTCIASPHAVGEIELEDGSWVKGFLCEPGALAGARDITKFGGWTEYQRAKAQAQARRPLPVTPVQSTTAQPGTPPRVFP